MFGVVPTKLQNSSNGHKILRTCTVHDNSKYNYVCGPYNASQIIVTKICGSVTAKILITKLFCNSSSLMPIFTLFECNLNLKNMTAFLLDTLLFSWHLSPKGKPPKCNKN